MELCRHLRWKSSARDSQDPLEVLGAFARNQVPYSCLRTCQAWGPDDGLAAPECCNGSRACFEPAPIGDGPKVA